MTIATAFKTTGLNKLFSGKGKPVSPNVKKKIILQIVEVVQQIKHVYLLCKHDNFTAAYR